jgi:hypothetical protein
MSPELIAVIGVCIPVLGNILVEIIRKTSNQKTPALNIALPPNVSLIPRSRSKDKAKSWLITGIIALIFGVLGYLLGVWLNFSPSTSRNNAVAPTLTPTPCSFHSKPFTRQAFAPSNLTGTIISPKHCEIGLLSSIYSPITVEGTIGKIPYSSHSWLFVYGPDGKYYPQCNSTPATKRNCTLSGEWSMRTYLGDECKPYFLVLISADNEGTKFLLETMDIWESSGSYTGLRSEELKPYEIKELYSIEIETGICAMPTLIP